MVEATKRTCPLCGGDNHCQHGETTCWCIDYKFPQELLDRVPENKKNACICKGCLEKFNKSQQS